MKKLSTQFSRPKNYLTFFVFAFVLFCSIPYIFAQSIPTPEEFLGFPALAMTSFFFLTRG